MTAISVLCGQAIMMLAQIVRNHGSIPVKAQNFFGSHNLFDTLLHLVANVISEFERHEDMRSGNNGPGQ